MKTVPACTPLASRPWPGLPVVVHPIRGESLPGFVMRIAAANFYAHGTYIHDAAGIQTRRAHCVASVGPEEIAGLKALLGPDADHLETMLYRKLPILGHHDFFGTPMRDIHREVSRRRVSPRGLMASPHIRAVWSLRPICFDPMTRERLLDHCPVCGNALGYARINGGVTKCNTCVTIDEEEFSRPAVDLRDFPQDLVVVDDDEALDFVTGLVDPEPSVRAGFSPSLPDRLTCFSRGEIFSAAVSLACAAGRNSGTLPKGKRDWANRKKFGGIKPEALALAGRALLDWPKGFEPLAQVVRAGAADRPGHFGVEKELAPLVEVTRDRQLSLGLRMLIRESIDADMASTASSLPTVRRSENRFRSDLVTIQEASRRFGFDRRLLRKLHGEPGVTSFCVEGSRKAPILLVEGEMVSLTQRRLEISAPDTLIQRDGIPSDALRSLARSGHIEDERGPVVVLMPGRKYYDTRSVQRFLEAVGACLSRRPLPDGRVALVEGMRQIGVPGMRRWDRLADAILAGMLEVWDDGDMNRKSFSNLVVGGDVDLRTFIDTNPASWDEEEDTKLPCREAVTLLATDNATIANLIKTDLLSPDLTFGELRRFSMMYMLTSEVRRRLQDAGIRLGKRSARSWLAVHGEYPALEFGSKGSFLWQREKINRLLS